MLPQPSLSKIAHRLALLRIVLQKIIEGLPCLVEKTLVRLHAGQTRDGLNASRPNVERRLKILTGFCEKTIIGRQVALRINIVREGSQNRG